MFSGRSLLIPMLVAFLLGVAVPAHGQQEALESITGSELLNHLKFISADEFMGRDTPSRELKIVARYLATQIENIGFEPLMPDGSYFQRFPLETTSLSITGSVLRAGEQTFRFPDDHPLMQSQNRRLQMTRRTAPRHKGATAILNVISEDLDREMEESGSSFRVFRRTRR